MKLSGTESLILHRDLRSRLPVPGSTGLWLASWRYTSAWLAALVVGLSLLPGCKSSVDNVDIKNTYGPIGRFAKNRVEQAKFEEAGETYVGLEELNAARKLYEEKKYPEARKAFHKIVKNKKWKNEPVVKDALFYRAETDYQMGHYPAADDGYAELLKTDPSTKYLEQANKRRFAIGCYWLKSPKPAAEIELASFTTEDGAERLEQNPEAKIPFQWRIAPNLSDKTRPLFDTPGRAVQALRSVTLHEVEGKLADDARMTLALYHLRKRDYREADVFFNEIRTYSRNEELKQAAYILGAHCSLKSYLGTNYDGKQLEEARKLTDGARRLYPESAQKVKLDSDLKKINAEFVEREWKRVEYYLRRSEKDSAAVYCEYIIEAYPDTPQAVRARDTLLNLGPKYAAGILTTPLFNKDPVVSEPAASESDEPDVPGRARVREEGASPAPVEE